jgi:hypothetical protein
MMRRTFALILIACLARPNWAFAALYQFTLKSEVTATIFPGAHIGDLVTIRYIANSFDLDPHPLSGKYAATGLTLELPSTTYSYAGNSDQVFVVNLTTSLDFLQYVDKVQHPQATQPWSLDVRFAFTHNTLTDALPLELPLADAIVRRFAIVPGVGNEYFSGDILSFTSVEIPEPRAWHVLGVAAPVVQSFRRRRHLRLA